MTYEDREQRRIIENDGNIGLFVDERQRFYTEIDGKKVFFYFDATSLDNYQRYGYPEPDEPIARPWFGSYTWSWYAAERVDDYIKVVDRTWAKPNYRMKSYLKDKTSEDYASTFLYEVLYFDLNGQFLGKDSPESDPFGLLLNPIAYRYGVQSHSDYIKTLAYRRISPLEQWAMSDETILNEFFNEKNIDTLLEDWAYKKYIELYPGEKVPSTYGIEGNYPSAENAYFGKKTLTGNFRDYKFYNRGSGKYEIKIDSGFDEITGMTLEFIDKTIDAVDDIKGVFDQVTGLNTDSGKMFRLYNAAFARFPDDSGLQYWIGKYTSGENDERVVASSFIASSEFKERYGDNVSNPKYVETLYTNVLGRDYDQSGYNYWIGNLNNGLETRYELLLGFAESTENKALFSEMTGFV